jgi:hypothetical protein
LRQDALQTTSEFFNSHRIHQQLRNRLDKSCRRATPFTLTVEISFGPRTVRNRLSVWVAERPLIPVADCRGYNP